ncbi:MAG TPA: hypothetical protein PKZ54_09390 [Syntrophorhabdaceae bacterium]|nr:hypothetical protein [Syntrophorhabdaceae bacterium]
MVDVDMDEDKVFFMLGIIHRDISSKEMLIKWLKKEMPQVITLELSNYGLTFREKMADYYKQKLEENLKKIKFCNNTGHVTNKYIRDIYAYLDIPYEYKAAQEYVRDYGGYLYLIDLDIFSLIKLKDIDKLLDVNNLRSLIDLKNEEKTNSELIFARLYFEKGIKTFEYTEEMRIRDIHMKNKISLIMRCHNEKRFLHICGWQHLSDPYNVYEPLKPIKVFIYD